MKLLTVQGGKLGRTKTSSFLTPGRSATTEMSLSDSRTSTLKLASGSVARSVCEAHGHNQCPSAALDCFELCGCNRALTSC